MVCASHLLLFLFPDLLHVWPDLQVARGEIPYPVFMKSLQSGSVDFAETIPDGSVEEGPKLEDLPRDLIISQAYMMWVEAGRPDGANFDSAARSRLMDRLQAGSTVKELEEEVYQSKKQQDKKDSEAAAAAAKRAAARADKWVKVRSTPSRLESLNEQPHCSYSPGKSLSGKMTCIPRSPQRCDRAGV